MTHFALPTLAAFVLAASPLAAAEPTHRLQGLFCNSEAQIDAAIGLIDGTPPTAALAILNRDAQVCTWVDLVQYVVADPVDLGPPRPGRRVFKYRASLVGVIVGARLRPVEPAAPVFFFRQAPLEGIAEPA